MKRILVCLLALALCAPVCFARSLDEIYDAAIRDAAFSDDDELYPLVTLVPGEDAIVATFHARPDLLAPGTTIDATDADLWVFSVAEMQDWLTENDADDWTLRFEQLLGLPAGSGCTHFSVLRVSYDDILRPAYVTDPSAQMVNDITVVTDPEYRAFFEANIVFSYFTGFYPWTRLGYTYDWNPDADEYGLTEFLIPAGGKIEVLAACDAAEFARLKGQIADYH